MGDWLDYLRTLHPLSVAFSGALGGAVAAALMDMTRAAALVLFAAGLVGITVYEATREDE